MSEGVKFDRGKPPISLVNREALEMEADVMAYGATKYARDNWRLGMGWSRLIDAAMRHIVAFGDGEDLDPETKLHHLAHARCCLAFLINYQCHGLGTDDRWVNTPVEEAVVEQHAGAPMTDHTFTGPVLEGVTPIKSMDELAARQQALESKE